MRNKMQAPSNTALRPIRDARPGDHLAYAYQDTKNLFEAVTDYVYESSSAESVILITTSQHSTPLRSMLEAKGISLSNPATSQKLAIYNAEDLLSSFMQDGMPVEKLVHKTIAPLIEASLKNHKSVRIYGEMVDILWQQENKKAAAKLERHWNALLAKYPAALLCAYQLDSLKASNYIGPIDCICSNHTHFLTPHDSDLLDLALNDACKDVMGKDLHSMLNFTDFNHPTTSMKSADASLIFMSKAMPLATRNILKKLKIRLKMIQEANASNNVPAKASQS